MNAHFDVLARHYQRYAEITDVLYRPWLRAALPSRGGRALDLGCGSGRYSGLLADRYDSVLAVDAAAREIAGSGTFSRFDQLPDVEGMMGSPG